MSDLTEVKNIQHLRLLMEENLSESDLDAVNTGWHDFIEKAWAYLARGTDATKWFYDRSDDKEDWKL